MAHGQIVVGPPGAGKSTYCRAVRLFHAQSAPSANARRRRIFLVNLDPAAEPAHNLDADGESDGQQDDAPEVDICELTAVTQIMADEGLGPNGALLAAMDTLEASVDSWLLPRLQACIDSVSQSEDAATSGEETLATEAYFVFDVPGQVEVTTCHDALARVLVRLQRSGFRLAVVHLADATHCADAHRFVSLVLVTLRSMLFLGCPQVNVLSKLDLVRAVVGAGGGLPLPIAYYLEADIAAVLSADEDACAERGGPRDARLSALDAALTQLAEDAGLVSFVPLAVQDRDCMAMLQAHVDRATGWAFDATGLTLSAALGSMQDAEERLAELVTERYLVSDAADDSLNM